MISLRPHAKLYLDKPFYLKIKITETNAETQVSTLTIADNIFRYPITVVHNDTEVANYVGAIGQILESEKIWDDPAMGVFDLTP